MSIDSVRAFFAEKAPDIAVIESSHSSATVALAAQAYGVEPGRIAKTLSLRIGERVVLIVASGTSRLDNKKLKARFGAKPKMLGLDEVAGITGHEVGGVCPFGLKTPLPVYCDISLRAFDEVVPAAGSTHSAVRIAPARMAELTAAEWVDVCETPSPQAGLLTGVWSAPVAVALRRRRLLRRRHAGIRFEHRAASAGELLGIFPEAGHDAIGVGDLVETQPPDVGRAGKLLFEGAAILLGRRRSLRGHGLKGDAAGDRHRKTQDRSGHSHVRSFFFDNRRRACSAARPRLPTKCGLRRFAPSTNRERRARPYSTLPIFLTAAIRRVESSATNLENSGASR
jgi:prolyl-tRNA editing enzyme YbaK/EbsC (Cys-tRNA(Pro) deacylase)